MKNFILTSLLIISVAFSSFSKDFEGEIKFSMKYTKVPEGMEMYTAMAPTKLLFKIKNHMFRTEMKQPMMGKISVIVDSKAGTSVMLTSFAGKKTATYMNTTGPEQDTVKIVKVAGSKVIKGYTCKKAEMRGNSGKVLVTYWYSTELPGYNSPEHPNLKLDGFPLEYTMDASGIVMEFKATDIKKKKIADSEFTIPKGYEIKKEKKAAE